MSSRFFDTLTTKTVEFNLGIVHRIYLNNSDEPRQNAETNAYQIIDVKPLNGTLPTIQRSLKARPLFRGISDSITRGDLVLFAYIAKKLYYMGPLNTYNNPNVSDAPFYSKKLFTRDDSDPSLINTTGYGVEYPSLTVNSKLEKKKNSTLDIRIINEYYDSSKLSDLTFEGRHGNSIRLGSRAIFPHLNISNNNVKSEEVLNDGSIISMLSNGSIAQNYGMEQQDFRLSVDPIPKEGEEVSSYKLNKGSGEESFNYAFGLESDTDTKTDFDQIIIFSDRITFDARSPLGGDFTVSSNNNINFGARNNFTLNNSGYSVINSNNIYLGVESKKTKKEPIVLGDELRKLLEDMAKILKNAHAFVQGVPIPLVDASGAPLKLASTTVESIQSITDLVSKLEVRQQDKETGVYQHGNTPFLSRHHFIEINRSQNNEG